MDKKIFICFFSLFCIIGAFAQDAKIIGDSLSKLKKEGKLNENIFFYNPEGGTQGLKITNLPHSSSKKGSNNNSTMSSTACNCWIPRDTSFHIVTFDGSGTSFPTPSPPTYANDDWSTGPMTLPFNFCFYGSPGGTASNPLFINNNGNITFGSPFSFYSGATFPCAAGSNTPGACIAPFWGDVQTTNAGSGYVYYQLTPTHLIVQWDSVTCYQSASPNSPNSNLKNTFQLIMTDGTDPILPAGNNVSFCYGDMQWAVGDASNPTTNGSGFGGPNPATVGMNKGDNATYVQVSRFGVNNAVFTNPTGNPASGINWLDYRSFVFDACGSGNNLPPLSTTSSNSSGSCAGDTLTICSLGDTLIKTVSFSGPEPGQHVTVTASAPTIGSGFSVLSSSVGTTGSLTFQVASSGLTAGNYYNVSVTGTDNGTPPLATTLNYVVQILNAPIPPPAISVNPAITCGNTPAVISLTNSGSYDSYTWSNGATTYSTSVSVTSTVQVTVTKNGCSKTGSAVAYIYPKPIASINGALTYCQPPANNTTLFANQISGTAPYSYNWNNGVSTANTIQATAGTYSLMITDAHGCKDSAIVTVTANSIPTLTITSKGSLCAGTDTLISSITNASSYLWTPGAGSNSTYTVNAPGSYSLAVVINSCTVNAQYTLSPPVTPTLTVAGDTSICSGAATTLTVSAVPAGGYGFAWYNGSSVVSTYDTLTITTAGTYSIVGVNNNTQCIATKVVTVGSYTNPLVSINGNTTYCKGHSDSLFAAVTGGHAPYNYLWSPSSATTQTLNAAPANNIVNATYSVTVTDSKGCQATAQILLKQSNPRVLVPNASFCPGKSVILTANGSGTAPLTYTWTNPAGVTPQQVIGKKDTIRVAGTYTLAMTDKYGCTWKDSTIQITLNPVPNANFSYSPTSVEEGVPVTFTDMSTVTTGSISSDSWTFGDTGTAHVSNPTHTYDVGGNISVTLVVKSDKGCIDTITEIINIQYTVIAPNIITPNGDGINEMLAFKNLLYYKNNKLKIFNRWGTKLYEDNDYKNNWTGKDLSDGTYFYILEIPEKHKTLNGFFESVK